MFGWRRDPVVTMTTAKRFVSIFALLLFCVPALPQSPLNQTTLIKTARGILVVHNEPGLNFTLELNGKNLEPLTSQDYLFVKVDGRVTQLHLVSIANFAPELNERKLNDWLVLERHRDWEAAYVGNLLGVRLKIVSEVLMLNPNRAALYWTFPLPQTNGSQQVKSQSYLSVISNGHVVMLNCAVEGNDTEALAKRFMLSTMSTLKISDKTIDVSAVQDAIRKGTM